MYIVSKNKRIASFKPQILRNYNDSKTQSFYEYNMIMTDFTKTDLNKFFPDELNTKVSIIEYDEEYYIKNEDTFIPFYDFFSTKDDCFEAVGRMFFLFISCYSNRGENSFSFWHKKELLRFDFEYDEEEKYFLFHYIIKNKLYFKNKTIKKMFNTREDDISTYILYENNDLDFKRYFVSEGYGERNFFMALGDIVSVFSSLEDEMETIDAGIEELDSVNP